MREFNKQYADFGDFTAEETRDAFRWVWNIDRAGRSVPVAELVSDSGIVRSHVIAMTKELERAEAGSEGDYLRKATELQKRHVEFLNSGIVQTTRKLTDILMASYDVRKLREHGGIPNAYRCSNVACALFACFLVRVIPGNIEARNTRLLTSVPSGVADPLAERIDPVVSADDIWKHIEGDMKSLDAERYIRRCIGGAVAMLTQARRENRLPQWYDQWFEPNYYMRFAPHGAGPRRRKEILGASTKADVDDGHTKLMIQIRMEDFKTHTICMHVPSDTPLKSLLEVAKQKYEDVRLFFGANRGLPQLFFQPHDLSWELVLADKQSWVLADAGVVKDWNTRRYIALYNVHDIHICAVPYAPILLDRVDEGWIRNYFSGITELPESLSQSISLKFTTAIRNRMDLVLQRFVCQTDSGPVDEVKLKEKLKACWDQGTTLTLDATLANLRDRAIQGKSYQLLKPMRNKPFPPTDKKYSDLLKRFQKTLDTRTLSLSKIWKVWTEKKLASLRVEMFDRGSIKPGKNFQIFCSSLSGLHTTIEICIGRAALA